MTGHRPWREVRDARLAAMTPEQRVEALEARRQAREELDRELADPTARDLYWIDNGGYAAASKIERIYLRSEATMTEITEFITAQLDREYRDAQLISQGGYLPQRWEVAECVPDWPFQDDLMEIYALDQINTKTWRDEPRERYRMALVTYGRSQDEHIARYDPERICAEIEAKRRLLALAAEFEAVDRWSDAEVIHRALAAPYTSQPGFKPEWSIDA